MLYRLLKNIGSYLFQDSPPPRNQHQSTQSLSRHDAKPEWIGVYGPIDWAESERFEFVAKLYR